MFQRFNIAKVARGVGFEVLEAKTGAECLELLQQHAPEALTLDLNMPDMTGFEVLEVLATAPSPPKVAVITADIQNTTRERVEVHPFVTLYNKPLAEATLKDFLQHALA
ncbi:hypothetical protein JCM14635_22920 [Megalodesulfovibrio paquesii]